MRGLAQTGCLHAGDFFAFWMSQSNDELAGRRARGRIDDDFDAALFGARVDFIADRTETRRSILDGDPLPIGEPLTRHERREPELIAALLNEHEPAVVKEVSRLMCLVPRRHAVEMFLE